MSVFCYKKVKDIRPLMKVFKALACCVFFLAILACDPCRNDDAPLSVFLYDMGFIFVDAETGAPLIKRSETDSIGIFNKEDIKFLDSERVEVDTITLRIEDGAIVYRAQHEVVNVSNLEQSYFLEIEGRGVLQPFAIRHKASTSRCFKGWITSASLVIGDMSYFLHIYEKDYFYYSRTEVPVSL